MLDDGRILLQYSLSLIGLDTIGATTFNTGQGSIPLDLPVTDNRLFVQQSMLRSGPDSDDWWCRSGKNGTK